METTVIDAIPVTTVARTLVDLAGAVPADHLAKALDEADRLRLLDMAALERAAERVRTRRGPGHAALTAAIHELREMSATTSRSPLERDFIRLVHRVGLPRPRTNAWIDGIEVDALWPDARLAVQLDGWAYHRSRRAFQRDREKDAHLTDAGYRVVRFTHHDVTHRARAVTQLLSSLLGGRHPG